MEGSSDRGAKIDVFRQGEIEAFRREENDLLTQVGPGTMMGDLFRQYWTPMILADELTPQRSLKRVRLLGEDLVVFRTQSGGFGLVGEFCSHRQASLYFGRVEGEAIRCLYHGWLYGTDGACLEMPNVPLDRQFCHRIRHPGYRCAEHGGVVWGYLGPSHELPPLPEFEWALVPPEQRGYSKVYLECNYLQAMEGGIDPTHVMFLHSPINLEDEEAGREQAPGHWIANKTGQRTPEAVELQETSYGFYYGAKRTLPDGRHLWRVNQWLMPYYTMPPGSDASGGRMWVPVDDRHTVRWDLYWYPTRELLRGTEGRDVYAYTHGLRDPKWVGGFLPETSEAWGDIRKRWNRENDYNMDWEKHYTKRMGVAGVGLQDICVVESEGSGGIMDRSKENLCAADRTTSIARRRLLEAARSLQRQGAVPIGAQDGSVYRVRGANIVLPADAEFTEGVKAFITVR